MSREAKQHAEEITALELDLTQAEVRAFVLATAPKEVRKGGQMKVDWLNIDAVALRAVRKVAINFDLTHAGARAMIKESFLSNYDGE